MYNAKDDKTPIKDKAHKADPAAPPVQEYPKMLYHEDGRSMTVANEADEAQATKDGFKDTPQPPAEAKEPKAKG